MKALDLTGKTLGELTVLERIGSKNGSPLWKCICSCNETCEATSRQLLHDNKKSCGHLKSPNLVGQTFKRLKVVERTDKRDRNGNVFYKCECSCKDNGIKYVTATDLIKGNVKSCGCLADESNRESGKIIGNYIKETHCIDGTNIKNLTMKMPKLNTSGTKGVTWDKSRSKWIAQIHLKGKHIHLGRFEEKEDAIRARKKAEQEYFKPILDEYNSIEKENGGL